MSERALNDKQFAEHIESQGGGSIGFYDRTPVSGKGFMVGIMPPSGQDGVSTPRPATGAQISDFRKTAEPLVAGRNNAFHGAWVDEKSPDVYTQDVSYKMGTPSETATLGTAQSQIAASALPGTKVQKGRTMKKPYGGDVLLHTGKLSDEMKGLGYKEVGATDVDPTFKPGANDISPSAGSFTKNQYANQAWDKGAGTSGGKKVSYGDVLRTINENRAKTLRASRGQAV
jgi:hypothetical protein